MFIIIIILYTHFSNFTLDTHFLSFNLKCFWNYTHEVYSSMPMYWISVFLSAHILFRPTNWFWISLDCNPTSPLWVDKKSFKTRTQSVIQYRGVKKYRIEPVWCCFWTSERTKQTGGQGEADITYIKHVLE